MERALELTKRKKKKETCRSLISRKSCYPLPFLIHFLKYMDPTVNLLEHFKYTPENYSLSCLLPKLIKNPYVIKILKKIIGYS